MNRRELILGGVAAVAAPMLPINNRSIPAMITTVLDQKIELYMRGQFTLQREGTFEKGMTLDGLLRGAEIVDCSSEGYVTIAIDDRPRESYQFVPIEFD